MYHVNSSIDTRVGRAAGELADAARAEAFSAFADAKLAEAYRIALLIIGDPFEAADATHDAFVSAWRGWQALRDQDKFDAWFGRILVNTCRTHLRGLRRRSVVDIGEVLERPDGVRNPQLAIDDRTELEAAFRLLSPDHREVVVLRYYLDLKVDEIAARLGIPAGTVKSRIHHALRALEAGLGPSPREDRR
jgi:RNA polymerase sigma factor (sigma-70 family)